MIANEAPNCYHLAFKNFIIENEVLNFWNIPGLIILGRLWSGGCPVVVISISRLSMTR